MSDINYNLKGNSLKQGIKFNNNNKEYINIVGKKSMKLIEQTTGNNLESLYENMEVMDNSVSNKEDREMNKLKSLENEFNSVLQEYKDTYQKYLTYVSDNNDTINKYSKTNIQDPNGKKYYVNEYGYTRGYSDNSWSKKPDNCLQSLPNSGSSKIYNMMHHGLDYKPGQPCNYDGKLIRNSITKQLSWISPEGMRHFYPNDNIYKQANLNGGCPHGDEIMVSDDVYNMFPVGDDMTEQTKCFSNNKDNGLMNRIVTLNSRLMTISQEMYTIVEGMDKDDERMGSALDKQRQTLLNEMRNLNNEHSQFETMKKSLNKIKGEFQDAEIVTNMNYLQYLGWTIGAIGVFIYTAKHMTS